MPDSNNTTSIGRKVRLIAFYLPQFHPIPENDEWWGKGFTDWTNVAKSKPRFRGHHQPRIPADLGFYDLRFEETRVAQAELAAQYGISGFCYYHYWFNGKMLLERPFNEVLCSGTPNFPFCLCWANENWSRRWDGRDQELLIEQKYDKYNCNQHIKWLSKAFSDERYIKIKGKPLFLIYNPSHIPDIDHKITQWRKAINKRGFPGIYLCSVMSFQNNLSPAEARSLGFDALVEFHPNPQSQGRTKTLNFLKYIIPRIINAGLKYSRLDHFIPWLSVHLVYSYKNLVRNAMTITAEDIIFPCVTPCWDNSARKRVNAVIIQNNDAKLYGKWLAHALNRVKDNESDEQIVFINAWNEWAEGCYLEPDLVNGRRFLEVTKKVLDNFTKGEADFTNNFQQETE
jgi:lipopolysaccharide biosynthesis protein